MSTSTNHSPRRNWARPLAIAIATLVIVPLALDIFSPSVRNWIFPPPAKLSCSNTAGLHRVPPLTATSSGDLKDEQSGVVHSAAFTVDGDARTAWAENLPGLGSGSWLQYSFDPNTDLKLVCIVNGYAKTLKVYQSNATIHDLSVTSHGATVSSTLGEKSDANFASEQSVTFPAGMTTSLRLTIDSAYAATGSQPAQDTCVSELYFYAK